MYVSLFYYMQIQQLTKKLDSEDKTKDTKMKVAPMCIIT